MLIEKPVIGLVGGIGAGKSLVARQMASLGAVVVDADALTQHILDRPGVRKRLVDWWGDRVRDADGRIDRAAVAQIVFESPDQRQRLEGLIHPLVACERDRIVAEARENADVPLIVIDAPLLLEAGWTDDCDRLVYVHASRAVRLQRVRKSRGWDAAELDRREKNQWTLDKKVEIADDIVDNDGSEQQCLAQVQALLARFHAPAESPPCE